MSLPDGFIDEIKMRIAPSELIGRTVALKRQGREFVGVGGDQAALHSEVASNRFEIGDRLLQLFAGLVNFRLDGADASIEVADLGLGRFAELLQLTADERAALSAFLMTLEGEPLPAELTSAP